MEKSPHARRIASIDIFRAMTMLTMLWVNDFAGMDGIPRWLEHAQTREDMMGFSDLVFPAFLFCMGLSIPFAVGNRIRKGEPIWKIVLHIALRALALIVMGVCDMNCSSVKGGLPHSWFWVIAVIGFFLIWNDYPKAGGWRKWLHIGLRICGIGIIGGLAAYRIGNGLPIKTEWWGILGLIGWAYLFSALIYLCVHRWKPAAFGAWAAVISLLILNDSHVHILGGIPGGWVHIGLAFTGVSAAVLMQMLAGSGKSKAFPLASIAGAAVMFAAGLVSHRFWIISQNMGTPTWMFFSLSASLIFLAAFYWLADIKGHDLSGSRLARIFILPAGTATLTCYTIPYLTYNIRNILHLWYPHAVSHGVAGLVKSLVFAFAISAAAWCLGRIHIRLKL